MNAILLASILEEIQFNSSFTQEPVLNRRVSQLRQLPPQAITSSTCIP